ncbi:MAG: hypothetical protein Q9221_007404 [Calogaya cf. arnoldii]
MPAISVPAIWGIGAGVFVVVLTVVIVIFFHLRNRHKTSREINRNSSQRRAHMSLTDEDVSRMPGMRRLRSTPYNHPPGWAPISSRESVAKKAWTPNPADIDPVTGLPPWPVRIPRRLKKSQSSPVVRMPPAALSPITERSTNNTATSPSLSNLSILDHSAKSQPKVTSRIEVYRPSGRPPSLDSSPGLLRPKALFHGSQRSSSHGNLATSAFNPRLGESDPTSTEDVELQNLQLARMPRSSSLCSQQPGQAPTEPVPPLPIELPATKEAQSKNIPTDLSPQRVSGISLLSGDTSVLDESASRAFSHAETDFTSISLTSPLGSHSPVGLGISTNNPKWNFSRIDRSASPLSASKTRNIRPQVTQQHSFRASVHNSLPRSASSGLSISLLDRVSPNPKSTLKPSNANSTLRVPPLGQLQSRVPLPTPNIFQVAEDKKSKRASTSVLQAVSGNQGSPIKNPWTDRPSSIATEDPFRWDPKTSMQPGKPSAMKNPAQRHKRRRTIYHPNRRHAIFPHGAGWPPLLSSSITPRDPPSELSLSLPLPLSPPQSSIFEKPTFSQKQEWDRQEEWNPTRPPSFLFQFPSPPLTTTTFSSAPSISNSTSTSTSTQHPPPRHPAHTIPHRSLSTSPSKPHSPTHHLQILGPRPLPTHRSRITKPSSISPRSSTSLNRRSASPAKADLLRRSILELRRMNSEVSSQSLQSLRNGGGESRQGRGGGHGRYLSLGYDDHDTEDVDQGGMNEKGAGEVIEGRQKGEEEGVRVFGGRGEKNGGERMMQGRREIGTSTPTKTRGGKRGSILGLGTPGSLYDGAGFLRDRGSGGGVAV